MKAYLIISMSFYNIDVDSCPSISRLQLLGALGLLDALKVQGKLKLV